MDYEKAYKEALERAKTIHNEHRAQCADIMTKVFPELAESEDERIRKAIKSILAFSPAALFDKVSVSREDAITWLEKQGEQKSAWSEEDEYQINTILQGLDLKRELYKKEGNKAEEDRYNTQYNWLKSLKPNHWKPSEYDISLLEEIARNIRNNIRPFCSEVSSLEVLIDTLKNL